MTYRNPKFVIPHALRPLGASAITSSESTVADPLSRLIDDQQLVQAKLSTKAKSIIDADRGTGIAEQLRPKVIRCLIPNHNFHENFTRVRLAQDNAASPVFPTDVMVQTDGTLADEYGNIDLIDFELAEVDPERFLAIALNDSLTGAPNHALGEWYVGEQIEPSTGIVQTWTDNQEPNSNVSTTEAGNTYVKERGVPRATWDILYQRISEEDAFLLERLQRTVGIQVHPFYFDPPDSGDVSTQDVEFVATPSNGTWAFSAGISETFGTDGNPSGEESLSIVLSTTVSEAATYTFDEPQDYSTSILRVDIESDDQTWLETDNLKLQLRVESAAGVLTQFSLSDAFVADAVNTIGGFHRVYVDPSRDKPSFALIPPDLSAVTKITFLMDAELAADQVLLSGFRAIDKEKRPVFCELLRFNKQQASRVPQFNIQYDVRLSLREVLS